MPQRSSSHGGIFLFKFHLHSDMMWLLQEVLSKAKDVAAAAVDQAKEGLSKAYSSAKNMVSGLGSGKDSSAEEL